MVWACAAENLMHELRGVIDWWLIERQGLGVRPKQTRM